MEIKSVSVVGLGYLGLPFAVFLAERGLRVVGVDADRAKVESLGEGRLYLRDEGLDEAFRKVMAADRLAFSDDYSAVAETDVTFIAVGTPTLEDGSQDLSQVVAAVKGVGSALKGKGSYHVVVVKSTILPETSRKVVIPALEMESGARVGEGLGYAYCPEFIREGRALLDFRSPSRVVIGEADRRSGDVVEALYRRLYGGRVPIIRTTLENAEIIKYASNAFLAMKVSFINTIARVCEVTPNSDVEVVRRGMGLDPRINPSYMEAGIGFGGSCLPKDLKALVAYLSERGYEPKLLKAVLEVNERQALWPVERLKEVYGELRGVRVAVLGLTFKEGTDDTRDSQSIPLIRALLDEGARVRVYDPAGMEGFRARYYYLDVEYAEDPRDCIRGADAAVIATAWGEFRELKPEDFRRLMRRAVVVDGRRIYSPEEMRRAGVEYYTVGTYHRRPRIASEM